MVSTIASSGLQVAHKKPKSTYGPKTDEPMITDGLDSDIDLVKYSKDDISSTYFKTDVVWQNVVAFITLHVLSVYGLVAYGRELGMLSSCIDDCTYGTYIRNIYRNNSRLFTAR